MNPRDKVGKTKRGTVQIVRDVVFFDVLCQKLRQMARGEHIVFVWRLIPATVLDQLLELGDGAS